ncbi:MAG: hypothetical protein HC780_12315 [Leptolyngbyaceae cyanobacterium CSU_1_3]|nr:hypothetical protein [Leptolyngbyaceae cyanobacterium CSU_1_3]
MVNSQNIDPDGALPHISTAKKLRENGTPGWLVFLVAFTQRQPFLLWSSVWLLTISLTWVGARSLIVVDSSEIEKPPPEVAASAQTSQQSRFEAKPASSFGLLAAIALGCGGMSFLLAKQLSPSKPQPRLVTRPKPRTAAHAQPTGVAIAPLPIAPLPIAPLPRSTPVVSVSPPVVTIVPPEEAHHLDWGNTNLADMMDIRKQKSVSSLM